MNIDIYNSNDSISNGKYDGLTRVTNSEEDELNRNKIEISKDFLITKDQMKNKDNELKPLFSTLMVTWAGQWTRQTEFGHMWSREPQTASGSTCL